MNQVKCPENQELVNFILNKQREMTDSPKGLSDQNNLMITKACFNVCGSKTHIKTLKEFSNVKVKVLILMLLGKDYGKMSLNVTRIIGVGKWILKLMKDFFVDANADAEIEERIQRVEKNKGSKKYVPQKNSAAYALLITLYRGTSDGVEFMRKQELIDAAEASGLSRTPIMPEIGKGKAGQFGVSSGREWYSGWNCMKNLIDKGLAVKSSCPAKYMLTEQGKEAARDCLARSGLSDSTEGLATINKTSDPVIEPVSTHAQLVEDSPPQRASIKRKKKSVDIPPDTLDKLVRMGYTKQQVTRAFSEVAKKSPNEETSSLWLSVLCRLREVEVYNSPLESENVPKVKHHASSNSFMHKDSRQTDHFRHEKATLASEGGSEVPSSSMRPCSSTDQNVRKRGRNNLEDKSNILSMPPLSFGDRFEDVYEVVLILDDREKFTRESQRSSKLLQQVKLHFKIPIEVRRLPVGDGIWIARHKQLGSEYVLDFIVERKNVDDLRSSIRDNRYREQKVRILDQNVRKRGRNNLEDKSNILSMPPLSFGDRFEDVYEVVLILDDREKFTRESQRSSKLLQQVKLHFKIPIEVRRLPVGDGIWIARHKQLGSEYVLDFIVERKNVDDLRSSIRDNRYREQKVRILRSGLKRLIYLVEGDPNACESAESIKTACMTTEILEGFDVQRTSGLGDTLRKYCHLTQSITQCYESLSNETKDQDFPICPPFDQFIDRCKELDEMTVSDVFATQLLQVPQVTEEIAIAVLDLYPTVISLARAYSQLIIYSLLMADKYVPEEIILQIIAKLPAKPLFRFGCVSKHWNRLISDPNFMKSRSRRMILLTLNPFHAIDYNVPVDDNANSIVPQVTEEVAIAVLDLYPTVISLARAYSQLIIYSLLMADKYVPEEIILQIIAKLPAKPLFRFGCVSKHWNRLISDPNFMKSRSRRMILLTLNPFHAIDYNVPVDDNANSIVKLRSSCTEGNVVEVVGAINGIVLLVVFNYNAIRRDMILYNPLTGAVKTVPADPSSHDYIHYDWVYGFGYGTTPDDLKIVIIKSEKNLYSRSCDVFSFKTKSWSKPLVLIGNYDFCSWLKCVFADGYLYWSVSVPIENRKILALDVKEMVFSEIQNLPPNLGIFTLGTFEGRLCIINFDRNSGYEELWVMNDRGLTASFSKVCQLRSLLEHLMSTCGAVSTNPMMCILDDGKIVMVKQTYEIIIYNMLSDSYKTVTTLPTTTHYLMANKYVPEEIILQIISKLPVKPLLRFKCVSKHWNLLISDPIFMKSRSRRILLISGNPIHAIDNNVPVNDKANLAFKLHSPFAEGKYASVAGTVNGIVLLFIHCDMILYNPLTSAYKKVPDHPHIHRGSRNYDVYGFGYGTTPDDLKIVIISSTQRRDLRSCDVYNLKTTSWNKPLELIGNYDFGDEYKGVFVNGFLYWNVYLSEQRSRILLALDVNKMVFSEIQDSIRHLTRFPLGTFKGRLCMIWLNRIRFKLELWVMNEHGLRTSFSKHYQMTQCFKFVMDGFIIGDEGVFAVIFRSECTSFSTGGTCGVEGPYGKCNVSQQRTTTSQEPKHVTDDQHVNEASLKDVNCRAADFRGEGQLQSSDQICINKTQCSSNKTEIFQEQRYYENFAAMKSSITTRRINVEMFDNYLCKELQEW
ncbi:restriction endonuclease, type II-like superfamily protein [Artemisia annua]|uniref:Crossover junction endonuclease MUS81 n=1 Tax=Artemisia annua TaxID=35608 RepID=A0A2U1MFQ5_ARTAN|nr:restriction endonuclease, type II-like superfamily protein [Artemisia annua]